MSRLRLVSVVTVLWSTLLGGLLSSAVAQSQPSFRLGHLAPEKQLFTLTWNGWKEPAPDTQNRTEQLFAEESVRDFIKQLGAELHNTFKRQAGNDEKALAAADAGLAIAKAVLTHPGIVFVESVDVGAEPAPRMAFICDFEADGPAVEAAVTKLFSLDERLAERTQIVTIDGIPFRAGPQQGSLQPLFGFSGSTMIFSLDRATAASVISRLKNPPKTAAWLAQLSKELAVERPSWMVHFNIAGIMETAKPFITDPMAGKVIEALGLTNVTHLSSIGGYDQKGIHLASAIATNGEPRGLLDLIPNKPLSIKAFEKIPASAVRATVVRFDGAHLLEQILKIAESVEPQARAQAEAALAQSQQMLGFNVKTDLLEALGDEWTFYTSGAEQGVLYVPSFVITATVRDRARLTKAVEALVARGRAMAQQQGPRAPFQILDFETRGHKGYRLQLTQVPLPIAPTWVITDEQLVIGITPQVVSSHLNAASRATLADVAEVKAAFARNPKAVMVSYSDPTPGLQGLYTLVGTFGPLATQQLAQNGIQFNLPPLPPMTDIAQHLAPSVTTMSRQANGWSTETRGVVAGGVEAGPATAGVLVALLLPAVQQAREAARRTQAKNNLKQIALSMHNYHETFRTFPARSGGPNGKSPLSWRVHLLPYLDANDLYQQFHLDEPWDSPHNKALIEKMPPTYQSPNDPDLNKLGKTRYVVPTGPGTLFDGDKALSLRDIVDGSSNTIMTLEAHRDAAVIWTKPDDLEIDFDNPLKGLKDSRTGGFQASLADGSVRFISNNVAINVLKALFTRAGGEVIGPF